MKPVSILFCAALLLASCPILGAAEASARPNIIFILTDDQGYGDVSHLNPKGRIPTPNVDRLAREGMTLTDAHSGSAV
ncbi:MAG TPA: sulfatase-like hydrolase/transferase, partial [Verrucomicrobiae bacterium]|nr:sulfatase-like hydrolase/transferase [Verrucomicrobiae bacterium]